MTIEGCKAACEHLGRNFKMSHLKDGKRCYVNGKKQCKQIGTLGSLALRVCKKQGTLSYECTLAKLRSINVHRQLEFKSKFVLHFQMHLPQQQLLLIQNVGYNL